MSYRYKSILKISYGIIICVLALASIVLLLLDIAGKINLTVQPYREIDICILTIFAIDYAMRFFKAEKKIKFFKENIFDLLAIIPFNSIFSAFRVFRVFRFMKASKLLRITRLLKVGAFISVLRRRIVHILKTNGFIYVLYANLALILCSSVIMMYTEEMTFPDALWWSIVTCTTVGYGDISPTSIIGRVVAVILMIFGIGLLGMLTGAITTYFTTYQNEENKIETDELQTIIENASDEERQKILEIAKIITGRKS